MRVAEDLVGLLHLLVGGVGLLVAGVAVRVVLLRQLAVRLLDLLRGGGLGDAEDFVGVAGHGGIIVVVSGLDGRGTVAGNGPRSLPLGFDTQGSRRFAD